MPRNWYAATLRGSNPGAIENVYVFDYYSQRKQWLTENHFPEGQRVKIGNRIAKKHLILPVTYQEAIRCGSKCWTWFYNNQPDFLI